MFGFVIGTLSLVGLMKVLRGGHWGHGYGGRGWRGGGPRRWMLRRLFERLDTTPGQEKVIESVAEEVERKAWAAREQLHTARVAYARAVRGEHFDSPAVGEAFDAQQAALEELKKVVREGLSKVHEALDPQQRQLFGDLIEFGPHGVGYGHGCHRGHHGRGYGRGGWRSAGGPAGEPVNV